MSDLPGANDLFHGEAALARATGIAQKTLAEKRAGLAQGEDWGMVSGFVRFSKKGLAKLMGALGLTDAVDLADLEVLTLELDEKVSPLQGVVKRFFTNRHLVEVELGDKTRARLRVRDSERFRLGMVVPLVKVEGDELYSLGRKEPRQKGRW